MPDTDRKPDWTEMWLRSDGLEVHVCRRGAEPLGKVMRDDSLLSLWKWDDGTLARVAAAHPQEQPG